LKNPANAYTPMRPIQQFNTDRKLQALTHSLCQVLAKVQPKKSIYLFQQRMDAGPAWRNQSALRAAVNTGHQANVAIYTMDSRGLEAAPPGGSATRQACAARPCTAGPRYRTSLTRTLPARKR